VLNLHFCIFAWKQKMLLFTNFTLCKKKLI